MRQERGRKKLWLKRLGDNSDFLGDGGSLLGDGGDFLGVAGDLLSDGGRLIGDGGDLHVGHLIYHHVGPSGIKNFNPGIFRDEILPNPGIPGFFGTGFPNIFDPGILLKSFGIFIFALFACRIG